MFASKRTVRVTGRRMNVEMNKVTKTLVGFAIITLVFVFSCQKKNNKAEDTILEGKATVYVDETILPIVEDEAAVFETEYDAKLKLVSKSENEIINDLFNDTARIVVLTRTLSAKELKAFKSKKITGCFVNLFDNGF